MATHRFIVSAGHRNTNRGGASNEINWTPGCADAIRDAIVARGGKAWIVQEEDGDTDRTFYTRGGLQQAAAYCVSPLAAKYGPFDAYISCHYNGGTSPGFHAIFPDARSGVDTKANNPVDVRLCRRIRDEVQATNTVGLLGWTRDSKGVMSEQETGVGAQGYRLGEFVGTMGFRETTARVILEAGSIDVARERAFINDPAWVRGVYARAVVNALEAEFGEFGDTVDPPAEPWYEKPVVRDWIFDLRTGRPFADAGGFRWISTPGLEYRVVNDAGTPRFQNPAVDGKYVGPPIERGGTIIADAVGTHLDTGQTWVISIWGTCFRIDHLRAIVPPKADMEP